MNILYKVTNPYLECAKFNCKFYFDKEQMFYVTTITERKSFRRIFLNCLKRVTLIRLKKLELLIPFRNNKERLNNFSEESESVNRKFI